MIHQDAMHVRIEQTGLYHYDGRNDAGRFSGTGKVHALIVEFPATSGQGRLAEGADLEEVFDHAITRAELMLRNLKKMKAEHLTFQQS
jgi:hypothetical protein